MAKLALAVALLALVVAVMAYQKASGPGGVKELQALRSAVEVMRKETADTLARIERTIRPGDAEEPAPRRSKP